MRYLIIGVVVFLFGFVAEQLLHRRLGPGANAFAAFLIFGSAIGAPTVLARDIFSFLVLLFLALCDVALGAGVGELYFNNTHSARPQRIYFSAQPTYLKIVHGNNNGQERR